MQATVDVQAAGPDGRSDRFTVRVTEGDTATTHQVILSPEDHARLGRKGEAPEAFVERCFRFLLQREPKEAILRRFDVRAIGRYFPEFEAAIRR
jgi:hypothetical protein